MLVLQRQEVLELGFIAGLAALIVVAIFPEPSCLYACGNYTTGAYYSGQFLGRRGFLETDESLKFRFVVKAIQIGVLGRPILVAITGGKGFHNCLERGGLF